MKRCDRPTWRGHRVYLGGIMDGTVSHLTLAHPDDYPLGFGTLLRNGQRSWYLREGQPGGDVTYRFVGLSRDAPDVVRRAEASERDRS